MMLGNIFSIERMAVHDGPGIRTVLFLKGCSLRCRWCHNPEGLTSEPVLGLLADRCSMCRRCTEVCVNHTIDAGKHLIDRTNCNVCGKCVNACPNHALLVYGSEITPAEAAALVLEDRDFYRISGGGATVSGGEPLLQPDFCAELFAILREQSIHCAVETCGNVSWTAFEKVLPYTDMFLYDIKAFSSEAHQRGTGSPNAIIIENLKRLSEKNISVEIRIPIIPGFNDSKSEIRGMAGMIAGLKNIAMIKLLPYHSFGQAKYAAIGENNTMESVHMASKKQLVEIAAIIKKITQIKTITGENEDE